MPPAPDSPEAVVQRQVDAYNRHDIEAFVATYAPDVQILLFPSGEVLIEGHAALRQEYAQLFASQKPRVQVMERLLIGAFVIDQERATRATGGIFEVVAIYEVAAGQIRRVWFLRG